MLVNFITQGLALLSVSRDSCSVRLADGQASLLRSFAAASMVGNALNLFQMCVSFSPKGVADIQHELRLHSVRSPRFHRGANTAGHTCQPMSPGFAGSGPYFYSFRIIATLQFKDLSIVQPTPARILIKSV